jgi:hypothetical protein
MYCRSPLSTAETRTVDLALGVPYWEEGLHVPDSRADHFVAGSRPRNPVKHLNSTGHLWAENLCPIKSRIKRLPKKVRCAWWKWRFRLRPILFLHVVSANILIPKFIANRLSIGPVAATVGILFWGWLWGVMGLLLAVPLTAFIKLVADLHPSLCHLSNMLALTPRPTPHWVRYGETAFVRAIPYLRGRPTKSQFGSRGEIPPGR